jgi:hypothetical protein
VQNIQLRSASRRTLISTFFTSIIAGGAFTKSFELFYGYGFPVTWEVGFAFAMWGPFITFLSILLRFYVGNLLHLKVLEDNPPLGRSFAWAYDFSFILAELSVIYFAAMCFQNNDVYRFLNLVVTLLSVDCVWIVSIWMLGKINVGWKRSSIPWPWLIINSLSLIFLIFIQYGLKGTLYGTLFEFVIPISKLSVVSALFIVAAIVDIVITDRHFLFPKTGWKSGASEGNEGA